MKKNKLLYLLYFLTVLYGCKENHSIQLFMAGDSTMANKPLEKVVFDSIKSDSISVPYMERGWGQLLPRFFNENIIVRNYAQNGRSSRTFIEQGWWDSITRNVRPNDFVIIQFGHNDQAKDKPDRYTNPIEYTKNLSRFVDDIQLKGANPIICTSVVRRRFDNEGVFLDSHGQYVELARQVARKKNVPLIDMYKKSKELLIKLGKKNSISLFFHTTEGESPLFPNGKIDNTHFREQGALAMDSIFIEGLKDQDIQRLINNLK